jgi:uncharacterized repeat protein (TIGR03803 family)
LYGTTTAGGKAQCNCGVVFKLDTLGKQSVLHNFGSGPNNGTFPYAGLLRDAAGNFFGTTSSGGLGGNGTVFELDPGGNQTMLYALPGKLEGRTLGRP